MGIEVMLKPYWIFSFQCQQLVLGNKLTVEKQKDSVENVEYCFFHRNIISSLEL